MADPMLADPPRPARDELVILSVLSSEFNDGRTIHTDARMFVERTLASMFGRLDASGDDRKRLNRKELWAVERVAEGVLALASRLAQTLRERDEAERRAEEAERLAGVRTQERDAALGAETAAWIFGEVAPEWRLSTMSNAALRELRATILSPDDYCLRFKPCLAALLERHIEERRAKLVSANAALASAADAEGMGDGR